MTLHIFNPEHDMALAANLENFTSPHAGRQMRYEMGYLPAIWAEEEDVVLVDDVREAEKNFRLFNTYVKRMSMNGATLGTPRFVNSKEVARLEGITGVDPWGWDAAVRGQLLRYGVGAEWLLSLEEVKQVRELSHRRLTASLLPSLKEEFTLGEAFECESAEDVMQLFEQYGRIVVKAPWSCSGRGVRFFTEAPLTESQTGWLRNVLKQQGSVMVEPLYNKVKDFGMEFECHQGKVSYCGLSLFDTANGAYTGNILATESAKQQMLERYIPWKQLSLIQEKACAVLTDIIGQDYEGPLGIDMMIVNDPQATSLRLHPCVEVNLRRTMGHVALYLSQLCNPQNDDEWIRVMRNQGTGLKLKLL